MEQDDEVDSDFSIDENDEPVSDMEEDTKGGKKKGGRLITKAYKVCTHLSFLSGGTTVAGPHWGSLLTAVSISLYFHRRGVCLQ